MVNILCPEPESFSKKGLNYLKSKLNLTAKSMPQHIFDVEAPKYDAVLVRFNTRVTDRVMGSNSKIKSILSPTTGLDHIDLVTSKKMNIEIFHLKDQKEFLDTISATAELAVALMLSVIRRIPSCFDAVKDNRWSTENFFGNEVSGKTIGIIGCGRLGYKVARIAKSLNMKIVCYDPFASSLPDWVSKKDTLREVLLESDIISFHVPLDQNTRHMISSKEVNQMKEGIVLINTSRGAIISSKALIDGLESGKIAAAGLDVLEDEHLIVNNGNPLIEYAKNNNNLIITSHIGGATYESVEKTDMFILNKYLMYLGVI